MSRFDDRLTQGFEEIAERVTPCSSALADFRARAAQHTPHEEVVIMLTPNNNQPRRPRWRVLTAAGGAAAVVLAVVGIIVLRSDTDDTAPPAVSRVEPLNWSRVPEDSTAFRPQADDHIYGVTAWGDGFVAVGGDRAAVWLSEDGVDWSLNVLDERSPEEDGYSIMSSVVAGGPGLVAVGVESPDMSLGGRATIWTSSDGHSWTKIAAADLGSDEPGNETFWFEDVTVGGPGLVAVGIANGRDDPVCGLCGGAVWTSVDGITWARAPVDPALLGGISAVAAGESGLVAVGTLDGVSRAWTSPDGLSWSVLSEVPELSAITATETGFVGVGNEERPENACHADVLGDCRATFWTSVDGITWTRIPDDDAIFGGGANKQMSSDVTNFGSGAIAVGTSVWYSPDGITWSRIYQDPTLAGEPDGRMTNVAVGESAVVVVGTDGDNDHTTEGWQSAATPIVWMGPLPPQG